MSRDASRADVTDPVLLVRINQLYHPDMSDLELYEATRGIWKVGGAKRQRVKYALAVFEGIVRQVYAVDSWSRAGSTRYQTRDFDQHELEGRWEFTGSAAPEAVRARYVGHSVAHYFRQGNVNPVMYLNVDDAERDNDRNGSSPHSVALARICELFHGLIRSRAREGGIPVPRDLPSLDDLVLDDPERAWFPVPGMYGGFAYRLQTRGDSLQLAADSWSRVVGGSGMRHVITPTEVILEEEGFA
jgi:hypothetical protein